MLIAVTPAMPAARPVVLSGESFIIVFFCLRKRQPTASCTATGSYRKGETRVPRGEFWHFKCRLLVVFTLPMAYLLILEPRVVTYVDGET